MQQLKIYEPESNVVAKNKNAEIKNNTTINDEMVIDALLE